MLCLIHSLCSFSGDTEVITPQHLLSVAGQSAKVLIDSGATDKYVDAAFAAANGLQVTKCEGHVLVVKSKLRYMVMYTRIFTYIPFQRKSNCSSLICLAIACRQLLGQSWLKAHKAVISYVNNCVPYFSGGRRRRLCFCPNAPDLPSLPANPSLLTHLQLKTMCRDKQNKLFLVHVSTVDEPSEVEEGELSTSSEHTALPQAANHFNAENADVFADTPPGLPPERGVCKY